MGSITAYETAGGKRYRVRYRKPDRTQTDKRGLRTKRDAELFLAATEARKATGEFIDASAARITINEIGGAWLSSQTNLKPSSLAVIEVGWRIHVGATSSWRDPTQRGAGVGQRTRVEEERNGGHPRLRRARRHHRRRG